MSATLRLGSRASRLALVQAEAVAAALGGAEVVAVKTDDGALGDKSRFVRGVETAILEAEVDLGVHSAKDLPGEIPAGLVLAGVPGREDPRDAFIGEAASLAELAQGGRIGTSSLRRRSQLLALRPDLEIAELRGNVDTRLEKLAGGDYDGIVLAAAGLARLGRDGEAAFAFGLDELTPSPGQGTLALEDRAALVELTAERAAAAALGGSCETPIGVCARFEDGELVVRGYAGLPDGSEWVRDRVAGDPDQPAALGEALAQRMLATGAAEILARVAA